MPIDSVNTDLNIAVVTFALAALAFAGLTGMLALAWRRGRHGAWLLAAATATLLWATTTVVAYATETVTPLLLGVPETIRTLAWPLFFLSLLSVQWRQSGRLPSGLIGILAAGGVVAVGLLAVDVGLGLGWIVAEAGDTGFFQVYFGGRLLLAVVGLAVIENFYRNTVPADRWSVRMVCLAIGGMFVYDVLLYAAATLFSSVDENLFVARGATAAIVAPLIAVSAARNPNWKLDVFVSRQIVFYSFSFVGSGIYLLVVAAAGLYLREVGGDFGTLLQVTFLFLAVLILALLVFSGQVRGRVRVFVNKHFFNYNYDYREEWLRFIGTVSSTETTAGLRERATQAICDIVDSPGGSLWMCEDDRVYRPVTRWNFKDGVAGAEPADSAFIAFLTERGWVVDLDDLRSGHPDYADLTCPPWVVEHPRAWIVVPLIRYDDLVGLVVLERARAPRKLDWEDFDLLKTVGRQVASYLGEQALEQALAFARQFEAFNKRFAFVMHDVKNIVSQLSLLIKNAEKHADNPAFREDMLETVRQSVTKMTLLLERISDQSDRGVVQAEDIELNDLLSGIVSDVAGAGHPVSFASRDRPVWVTGDRGRLAVAFQHVIQNGADALIATRQDSGVEVTLGIDDGSATITIADNGCGMDEAFVQSKLFKPFTSTKETGYGIGAYESRQIFSDHRGRMDVDSTPGRGTTLTVRLPLSTRSMVQSLEGAAVERP